MLAVVLCGLGLFGPGLATPGAAARTPDIDPNADCSSSIAQPYVCVTSVPATAARAPVIITRDQLFSAGDCTRCNVVNESRYRVRTAPGHTSVQDSITGLSVGALIDYAYPASSPPPVTFVEIRQASSTRSDPSLLDSEKALGNAQYENGLYPVVYFTGDNPDYLRPLLRGSTADVNGPDNRLVSGSGADRFIHVIVHTEGMVLHPKITAISGAEKNGKKTVRLNADVPDAGGRALTYSWDCGGGTPTDPPSEPSVSCTYSSSRTGAAYPSVVVTSSDTSYGRALLGYGITVDPVRGGADPTGGGKGRPSAPPSGAKTGSGDKSGGAPTDAAGRGDLPGNGAATTTPVGRGGEGTNASRTAAPRTGGPSPGRSSSTRGRGAGTLVSGQLLLAAPGAVPAAGPSADPGRANAAAARRASNSSLDLRWLLWLVPIGLIALGVFTERRRPRRRSSHS